MDTHLQETVSLYRTLFKNAPVGIGLSTMDGHLIACNDAILQMIGFSEAELSTIDLKDFYPDPEDRERILQRLQSEGVVHSQQFKVKRKDGSPIYITLTVQKFIMEGMEFILTFVEDVSARATSDMKLQDAHDELEQRTAELTQANQALQLSEQRLNEAQEMAHVGSFHFNAITNMLWWSDEVYRIFGRDRPLSIPHDRREVEAYIHPEDLEKWLSSDQRAIAAGHPVATEYRAIRPDGSIRYHYVLTATKVSSDGRLLEISGTVQDITERKLAELAEREQHTLAEALRDTAAALNSTLQLDEVLDRILDNVIRIVPHEAVNVMMIEAGIAQVSRLRGYTGRGLEEAYLAVKLPVQNVPMLNRMNETGKPCCIPDVLACKEWVTYPESQWIRSYASAPIRVKNETVGFINLDSSSPGFFNENHAECLQAFAHQAAIAIENARLYNSLQKELEERKMMEESLLASQKMAALGTLAGGMAHEINSPLQIITGVSDRILRKLNQGELSSESLPKDIDMINRNAWRVAEIVRSLLVYARPSKDEMELHDLNYLVRDTLLLIEHQLKSWSSITVKTNLMPQLPLLRCDPNKMTEVIINLLTNARDAMPDGGEINISTRYDPQQKNFTLAVADTGQGIPEEYRQRIFDPFFTTKPVGKGTGLGLSIVQGIVRAHGGSIEVDSHVGTGTRFRLIFPINQPESSDPSLTNDGSRFNELR